MRWIVTIVREIFGLFVDDGSFALAVLAWIGLVWLKTFLPQFILGFLGMPRRYHAYSPGFQRELLWSSLTGEVVLFLGLAFILTVSVIRFSRKARRSSTSSAVSS